MTTVPGMESATVERCGSEYLWRIFRSELSKACKAYSRKVGRIMRNMSKDISHPEDNGCSVGPIDDGLRRLKIASSMFSCRARYAVKISRRKRDPGALEHFPMHGSGRRILDHRRSRRLLYDYWLIICDAWCRRRDRRFSFVIWKHFL